VITVAHIITKLELGGAQENTIATCAGLETRGFRVALIHGPGGMLDEDARQDIGAANVHVVESLVREVSPRADLSCLRDLTRLLEQIHTEHRNAGGDPRGFIVHTHSSKAGVLGRIAARAAGVPLVVHSIHGFGFHEGQRALKFNVFLNAERAASLMTDAFISVSHASAAEARARGIVRPHQRLEVIRSGFDLDAFRKESSGGQELRRQLGFTPDDEVIVSIANLKPQKDPLTLVEAMKLVTERRPRAKTPGRPAVRRRRRSSAASGGGDPHAPARVPIPLARLAQGRRGADRRKRPRGPVVDLRGSPSLRGPGAGRAAALRRHPRGRHFRDHPERQEWLLGGASSSRRARVRDHRGARAPPGRSERRGLGRSLGRRSNGRRAGEALPGTRSLLAQRSLEVSDLAIN
jgi:hypothetical protein